MKQFYELFPNDLIVPQAGAQIFLIPWNHLFYAPMRKLGHFCLKIRKNNVNALIFK